MLECFSNNTNKIIIVFFYIFREKSKIITISSSYIVFTMC